MSFDGKTGLHFERVYIGDGYTLAGEESIGYGFVDYGGEDPIEQPEFFHLMGRPEALALWSLMRARLGIDRETEAMTPEQVHGAWRAYVERGEGDAFDQVCEQLGQGLLVVESTEFGQRIRAADGDSQ